MAAWVWTPPCLLGAERIWAKMSNWSLPVITTRIAIMIRAGTRMRHMGPQNNRGGGKKRKGRQRKGRKKNNSKNRDWHLPSCHPMLRIVYALSTQAHLIYKNRLVNIVGISILNVCRSQYLHRSDGGTAGPQRLAWGNAVSRGESRGLWGCSSKPGRLTRLKTYPSTRDSLGQQVPKSQVANLRQRVTWINANSFLKVSLTFSSWLRVLRWVTTWAHLLSCFPRETGSFLRLRDP